MPKSYNSIWNDAVETLVDDRIYDISTYIKERAIDEMASLRKNGAKDSELKSACIVQILYSALKLAIKDHNESSNNLLPTFKIIRMRKKPNDQT